MLNERNETVSVNKYNFDLYRTLVNMREAKSIDEEYLKIEDVYLQNIKRNITDSNIFENKITLWKGDITTLKVDSIVNATNNQMLGCFLPGHLCIDNAIHTYSGIRLRLECNEIMKMQGYLEPTGKAKITKAYNLPCQYIIHTVGPIVQEKLLNEHKELLKECYKSCFNVAKEKSLESIAFCCISTGVFRFPKEEVARIAVKTIKSLLKDNDMKVIVYISK